MSAPLATILDYNKSFGEEVALVLPVNGLAREKSKVNAPVINQNSVSKFWFFGEWLVRLEAIISLLTIYGGWMVFRQNEELTDVNDFRDMERGTWGTVYILES